MKIILTGTAASNLLVEEPFYGLDTKRSQKV
jgi:hypothetical protein